MATLPRASKLAMANPFFQRTQSEFDVGLNTSAAWTEHLESSSMSGSLSDEEPDISDSDETSRRQARRPGRALYDFEGKAEFRELSVSAGDALEVVKEDLADGWSLVRNAAGEVGLLPRTYYTVRFLSLSSDRTHRDGPTSSLHLTLPLHPTWSHLHQPKATLKKNHPPPILQRRAAP